MGVRWDVVVQDKDFWSECARPLPAVPVPDENRSVRAWLFGSLAEAAAERPVTVEFHGPCCVGDVVAELGRRYGRPFLDKVSDGAGGVSRNCRVFVNGQPVDDVTTPIRTDALQTDVELILLTAAEGG